MNLYKAAKCRKFAKVLYNTFVCEQLVVMKCCKNCCLRKFGSKYLKNGKIQLIHVAFIIYILYAIHLNRFLKRKIAKITHFWLNDWHLWLDKGGVLLNILTPNSCLQWFCSLWSYRHSLKINICWMLLFECTLTEYWNEGVMYKLLLSFCGRRYIFLRKQNIWSSICILSVPPKVLKEN